ncbi:MAG: hypothetical protein KUG73_03030 [Pseudomonadales bacterium]|nr:hypothetical protein [Pseudomonadales bacterium]
MKPSEIPENNPSPMERPLGLSEKLMFKMRDYGGMNVCCITQIEGNLDKERLLSALSYVVLSNPILNVTTQLTNKKNKPIREFVIDNNATLPFVEKSLQSEEDLYQLMSQEIQTLTPIDKKMWRLTLASLANEYNTFYLVATFDHTIIDGQSTNKFIEMLLDAYKHSLSSSTHHAISLPAEHFIHYKVTLSNILRFISHEVNKLVRTLTPLKFNKTQVYSKRNTKLLNISFTTEQTEKLILTSRFNNTTLQGAIVSALLFSRAKHANLANKKYRFCNASPVNLRKQAGINDSLIGAYSSSVETIHDIENQTSFWSLAKEIKQKIVNEIDHNSHLSAVIILEYLQNLLSDNLRMSILDGKQMGRLCSTTVSNFGKIDFRETYGNITVSNYNAAVSQHGFGACFTILPMTFNGSLRFFLHYISPLTTEEQANEMRCNIIDVIQRALESDFTFQEFDNG